MSIPLTQLGARAFNHPAAEDVEAEYDRLRELAREEAIRRNKCFDRAHAAYERGDGAEAKELSNEGKRHAAKMDEYNKQASEFIFRENNASGRVAEDEIDLHGQFVEEAEDILEERIRAGRNRGETHLHVIVGKGNHSAGHVQKIRPRVEQLCREMGLKYHTEENEGRIYVELGGGGSGHYGSGSGAHHGAGQQHHGGQPHHGGQQHHGGQHQQEDESDDLIGACLKCCVVM